MRGLCEPRGTLLASDVATTDLIAVMPDDTLETAARLMVEYGTAHLVVASPQTGLPVGIVSTLDIARVAAGVPRGW
jgi:CBS domain-containing protein